MRSRSARASPTGLLSAERTVVTRFDFPFYLVLLFLLIDYGRPQSFFPFIEALHPGWFIQSALFICLISSRAFNLRDAQTKCFVILLVVMAIHVPFAVNNYMAFQILRSTFLYFIVYLSIVSFVNSYPKIEQFIDSWIIINVVCAVVGLMNGGKIPNSSFMGDENDFALVMAMALPFAYFMFMEAESVLKKVQYISAVGIFVAANVASLSRGGFIGLTAVCFFCWLMSSKKMLSTVVASLVVAVWYWSAPPTYWDEVKSIKEESTETGTGQERWYSWQCGWRMFLDNPIIGVGQGNFPWNFERYEPAGGLNDRLHGGRAAHSVYFTVLPELGSIGMILFLRLLTLSWSSMKPILNEAKAQALNRRRGTYSKSDTGVTLDKLKHIVLGVQGAFIGYLVSGVFLSVLYYPHFWILMAFSLAIANVSKQYSQSKN